MNTSLAFEEIGSTLDNLDPRLDTAWAENNQLGQCVLEAVRSRDESPLKAAPFDGADRALPPSTLLALIVYCYAAGIYASEDIEARLQSGGTIRVLRGPERLGQHQILRFRRDNVSAVVSCLERTLALALTGGASSRSSAGTGHQPTDESLRLSLANLEAPAAEAQRRVRWAVFLDSMARDD